MNSKSKQTQTSTIQRIEKKNKNKTEHKNLKIIFEHNLDFDVVLFS